MQFKEKHVVYIAAAQQTVKEDISLFFLASTSILNPQLYHTSYYELTFMFRSAPVPDVLFLIFNQVRMYEAFTWSANRAPQKERQ